MRDILQYSTLIVMTMDLQISNLQIEVLNGRV